jgi:hypothetical protein
MGALLSRLASPVSYHRGFQLALLAVAMMSSIWVVILVFMIPGFTSLRGVMSISGWANGIAGQLAWLGLIPLMFAIIALVRRPVTPSWLLPIALALALCLPAYSLLGALGLVNGDIGLFLLLQVVTGSAIGVLAAGMLPFEGRCRVVKTLLIAVGVSIAATGALWTPVVVAIAIAIILAVMTRHQRHRDAPEDAPEVARDDVASPETVGQ